MSHSVLLVDDESDFLEVLARYFTRRGFEVFSSLHPAHALAAAETHQFDAAIVDRKLPETTGLLLMKTLLTKQPQMQIIILSGITPDRDEALAVQQGAFAYLIKPCGLSAVVDTVQSAIRSARTETIS